MPRKTTFSAKGGKTVIGSFSVDVDQLIQVGEHVVAVASVIAALVPTPQGAAAVGVLGALRKFLDFAAMNWGHAANAPKPEVVTPVSMV